MNLLLYCNFHLSFNHCIFTLLCVQYVLFYCTNPAFGCYISVNFFFYTPIPIQKVEYHIPSFFKTTEPSYIKMGDSPGM